MPPRPSSRFQLSAAVPGSKYPETLVLTERKPFRFKEYPDNIPHVVTAGDSIFTLAERYFSPIPNAAMKYWAIADFQPDPIHDPTIALIPGSTIIIPPLRVVLTELFAESRREA
jgi:hypothetical protein